MNLTHNTKFASAAKCDAFVLSLLIAFSQLLAMPVHAATMDVLLDGNDLELTYPNGASVTISFEANGTYLTSGGSSGSWTLNGETLCTVRDTDGFNSCGTLASNKTLGDEWVSVDGNGTEVTARVVERE